MNAADLPLTVTVEQAGKLLGVSRGTAYEAARRGQLPTLRLGRRLLVPRARLLELLGENVPSASCMRSHHDAKHDGGDMAAGNGNREGAASTAALAHRRGPRP